ncbi:MAG: DUF1071 domain-containing protein [Bacillus sp. (in: firmicutes)]|uniref:Sak single strand annealing protein n=1 Tax=Bacillus sp. TaxID=1409 RepID=UPI0039E3E8F9
MSNKTLFQQLYDINVNDKLDKKANLSYLSWAWAWAEVKKVDPNASNEVHEFPLPNVEGVKVPYLQTPTGYFVKVSVTIKGQTETEWLPVMDHRNKTIEKPNAFDINKNTKRCLVKAIALHGLGLYVYAGEDLPEVDASESSGKQTNHSNRSTTTNKPSVSGGNGKASEKQMKMIHAKIAHISALTKTEKQTIEDTLKGNIGTDNLSEMSSQIASKAIEVLMGWEKQYSQAG